jgi:hypothetical protein
MDDQERIHGDEPYEPEQERTAAEDAAATPDPGAQEAEESERALAAAGADDVNPFDGDSEEAIEDEEDAPS